MKTIFSSTQTLSLASALIIAVLAAPAGAAEIKTAGLFDFFMPPQPACNNGYNNQTNYPTPYQPGYRAPASNQVCIPGVGCFPNNNPRPVFTNTNYTPNNTYRPPVSQPNYGQPQTICGPNGCYQIPSTQPPVNYYPQPQTPTYNQPPAYRAPQQMNYPIGNYNYQGANLTNNDQPVSQQVQATSSNNPFYP